MRFSYAGVSRLNGALKARFANSAARVNVLTRRGHTDVNMIQVKAGMSKDEAIAYLLRSKFDAGDAEIRNVLEDALVKNAMKKSVLETRDRNRASRVARRSAQATTHAEQHANA